MQSENEALNAKLDEIAGLAAPSDDDDDAGEEEIEDDDPDDSDLD